MKRREKQIELISLLEPYKLTQKTQKINLFGKGIVMINQPDSQQDLLFLAQIQTIDLSHNAIQSVKNIKFFTNLKQLNISHNKISSQDELISLLNPLRSKIGRQLNNIQLKGNPFLKQVIKPQLKRLFLPLQNDINIFSTHEMQSFDMFVQKSMQMFYLSNIQHKTQIHIQMSNEFIMNSSNQKFQTAQFFYRIIRNQVQSKMQRDYLLPQIKKMVSSSIPLQKFISQTNSNLSSNLGVTTSSLLTLFLNEQIIRFDKLIKQEKKKLFQLLEVLLTVRKSNSNLIKNHTKQKLKQQQKQQRLKQEVFKQKLSQSKQKYNHFQTPIKNYNLLTVPKQQFETYRYSKQIQYQSSKSKTARQEKKNFNSIEKQFKNQNNHPISIKESGKNLLLMTSQQNKNKIQIQPISSSIKNYAKNQPASHNIKQSSFIRGQNAENSIQDQSKFQKIFFQILTKANPVYHLLYSPLQSLKPKQKDLLIPNLHSLLKQKHRIIQKLQKKIKSFEQVQNQNRLLRQKLQLVSIQCQEVRENMKFLQENLRIRDEQSDKLSSHIDFLDIQLRKEKLLYQNASLQQKILLKEYEHKNDIINKQIKEEQKTDKIKDLKQKILKKQYFRIICLKAKKLYKFQLKMKQIKQTQAYLIKNSCFQEWFYETRLDKNKKKLKNSILKRQIKKFRYLTSQIINQKLQESKNTQKIILLKKKISISGFKKIIMSILQLKNKMKINQEKSLKHFKQHQQKLRMQIFQFMKLCILQKDQAKEISLSLKAYQHYQLNLASKVFKEWLVWTKFLFHKQIQIKVIHKERICRSVFENLSSFYFNSREYESKIIQLGVYLRTVRKAQSFDKFMKNSRQDNRKFKISQKRILLLKKNEYFTTFLQNIRSIKLTERIRQQDQIKTKRAMMYEDDQRFKKLIKISFTKKTLYSVFHQYRISQILQYKKEFEVQNLLKINQKQFFFSLLSKNHHKQQIYINKKSQLRLLLRPKLLWSQSQFTVKTFFTNLKQVQRQKKLLRLFLINKNYKIMLKYFSKLRIQTLVQKSNYYVTKLNELGPQIKQIQNRQLATNNQKIQLLRQLSDKNFLVDQYEKQIKELRILLESKQIKYQKLKDIYSESVGLSFRESLYDTTQYKNKQLGELDNHFNSIKYNQNSSSKYQPERDLSSSLKKKQLNSMKNKSYYQNIKQKSYLYPSDGNQIQIIDQNNDLKDEEYEEYDETNSYNMIEKRNQKASNFNYLKESFRRF